MEKAKKTSLSAAEWRILTELWEHEPSTSAQITLALKDEKNWDKHTVITLLKRMEAKGAVTFEKVGNTKEYHPILKREDVAVSETRSFLDRMYRGSLGMMINSLVEQKALSKKDIGELYDILKKAEEEAE